MLLCPVRECHAALSRDGGRLVCPYGHSFDVARSGYVNLLQPQDRRSKHPGDTIDAVLARRRLHDLGVTTPLLEKIGEFASVSPSDVVLDAGCGDGFYLGSLAHKTSCRGSGVDISIPTVDAAARRYPECEWIVANADRFIPYAEHSFSLVLSITGRRNAAEFQRILRHDARLFVALPAPNDLIELRGVGRDRVPQAIADLGPAFTLQEQQRVTTSSDLDAGSVSDVLHSIYRPMRSKPIEAMRVTFSLDLLMFRK